MWAQLVERVQKVLDSFRTSPSPRSLGCAGTLRPRTLGSSGGASLAGTHR